MTDGQAAAQSLAGFFAGLEQAPQALLMLDYDGTLAPFCVDPARARPYPGVSRILDVIMQEGTTRVVLVTGRRAAEMAALLGTRVAPEVWGSHGWERLSANGALSIERAPQAAVDALMAADAGAERAQHLGARIERKPISLAVHWRGLPEERVPQIRATVEDEWIGLCRAAPLAMLDFDGGLELRATGRTKADAVTTVLRECGRDTAAAFLGDDLTDEDGFAALHGRGLAILVRGESRPTAAAAWLRPPDELVAFLERWQQVRADFSSSDRARS